ncbi:MAG TPA: cell division protein FtsW, partial [Hyphomonas atlantica]|nr:cell division protein FtsW [Hyphomonas atlantica]
LLSLAAGPSAATRIGYDDPYFFVLRQVCFVGLGAIIMVAVSMLDRAWARRFATFVFVA